MVNQRLRIIFVPILLILGLAACVRPASTPPGVEATPTNVSSFPVPGATDDVMSQLEKAATQTVMAQMGTPISSPTPVLVEATPVPVEATPVTEATTVVQLPEAPVAAAATSTPISVPTATPGIPSSWTLQKGEHPYCIARRFNVNPDELLRVNGLSANSLVYGGMVLKIPQTGNPFPAARTLKPHPDNYTVSSGDTIYSIACLYGDADPYAIAAANGLTSPYTLKAGQTLYIP